MAYTYRGGDHRDTAALGRWLALERPEEVLEPGLPIVDPHHHLWDGARGRYLFDELLADLGSGHNIVGTVVEEAHAMYRAAGPEAMRPVGEVEFVRGVAAMSASGNYGRTQVAAGMVARADLALGEAVRPVLEAAVAAGGGLVKGVRYSTPWDPHEDINRFVTAKAPPERLRDPGVRAGLAELERLGLVFDAWIYFTQIPDLTRLARAMPGLRIVLNHCGGPVCVGPYAGHRDEYRAVWAGHLRELAACPNVFVKAGGLGMLHFGFDFHLRDRPPSSEDLADAWRPYIDTCVATFGPDRTMFESNFPPDKQSCSYRTLWNGFKRLAAGLSPAEKQAVFAGTASRVYALPMTRHGATGAQDHDCARRP